MMLDEVGSGSNLSTGVLIAAVVCAAFSTILSVVCIVLQLRNYRKVNQQRWVVRILVMVPIYSISSCVSLFSLDAAFFIDLVRDLYEAFVIYCFFSLLIEYLCALPRIFAHLVEVAHSGGERSLIIMLHGRPPTPHPWPVSKFISPMDVSDPYTFLALKRGILSYVQIKPILAILTVFLKATGTYNDGQLKADAGYTYISVVYNFTVSLSLYCLAMFWVCTHEDLKPFRPAPKFICVKGIICARFAVIHFQSVDRRTVFSFWQGFVISVFVKAGIIRSTRISDENFSLACQDALICFEMVGFAILHIYAFSYKDYIDKQNLYSGRLPFFVALKDCLFGYRDVFQDSLSTLRGTGFSYRTFEPVEGGVHQGLGRDRRVRAGLRYVDGGKSKRWLPMPGDSAAAAYGRRSERGEPVYKHPIKEAQRRIAELRTTERGYAPISPEQAQSIVHDAPNERQIGTPWREYDSEDSMSETSSLGFGEPAEAEEKLYEDSRQLEFGDYNYPVTDASKEEARRRMRKDEENIIAGWPKKQLSPAKGKAKAPPAGKQNERSPSRKQLPDGCVDLLVEDRSAEAALANYERHKGDPNHQSGRTKKVYRRIGGPEPPSDSDEMLGARPRDAFVQERRKSSERNEAFTVGEDDQQEDVITADEQQLVSESEPPKHGHKLDRPELRVNAPPHLEVGDPWRTV